MPVSIKGSGGGSVTLDAGAAAADTTLTLPNVSGTVLQSGTAVTAAQGGTGLTAPGTAGNVLTSTGAAWTSSAPTPTASLTLLATLTTTSGTTQSATGLATTFNNLVIVAIGVNTASATDYLMATSANNGSSYGTAAIFGSYGGSSALNVASTILFGANQSITIRPFLYGYGNVVASSTSGPINAIRFSLGNAGTFTAGTIYIYGWN